MDQPGLDHRHRDKDGRISKKHGNTEIGTLRHTYGANWAPRMPANKKLSEVLQEIDEPSLSKLCELCQQRPAGSRTDILYGDKK
jgi:hypothetical protein